MASKTEPQSLLSSFFGPLSQTLLHMTILKVSTEMRPINFLSFDVNLPDAEAEFLNISGVHCIDFAIIIKTAVIIMAVVTVLVIKAIRAFVTIVVIKTVMVIITFMTSS